MLPFSWASMAGAKRWQAFDNPPPTTTIESVLNELLISYPECIADKHHYKNVLEFIEHTPATNFEDFMILVSLIDPSEDEGFEEDIDEVRWVKKRDLQNYQHECYLLVWDLIKMYQQ